MSTVRRSLSKQSKSASLPHFFKAPYPISVIIPQGLLLEDLNHSYSILAMDALAAKQEKKITWTNVLKDILAIADQFSIGRLDNKTFREQVLAKLDLDPKQVADADFDQAWNAMLGDLSNFFAKLTELKDANKSKNVFLVSGTNPLHMQALFKTVDPEYKSENQISENPAAINGVSLYVSYLQTNTDDKERLSHTNILAEIIAENTLKEEQTLVVVSLTSYSPVPHLKKANEATALKIKEWAESRNISVVNYDRKTHKSISEAITNYLSTKDLLVHSPNSRYPAPTSRNPM